MRLSRASVVSLLSVLLVSMWVPSAVQAGPATASTYDVQVDAKPPAGEDWTFLKFFPGAIEVHSKDVIHTAWKGLDTPHTTTFVATADPEGWRAANQGPGGPYEVSIPDSAVGGDDPENIINPSVGGPSAFGCGDVSNPCIFDGTSVLNSGVLFPFVPPSDFYVSVTAPVGTYSLLCLLHPGMEIPVDVRPDSEKIPSPAEVRAVGQRRVQWTRHVDGHIADAQAQDVTTVHIGEGHILWTINAGGFSNNVSANEFVESGLTVRVDDRIQVNATEELHTATFPLESTFTTPFTQGQCEVPGPDIPAQSPADCADPAQFQVAFNNTAVIPTPLNRLRDPTEFVNSGLLVAPPQSYTFVAKRPGTYTMVCLVHGAAMTTTVTVESE